jgi:hypothetical protein
MKQTANRGTMSRLATGMNPTERPMTSHNKLGYTKNIGKDKDLEGIYY